MKLQLENRQVQQLYPRMEQSLAVLGMNETQLDEYLENYVDQNPLIEIEKPVPPESENLALSKKLEWLMGRPESGSAQWGGSDASSPMEKVGDVRVNLWDYLIRQLGEMKLVAGLFTCAAYLVGQLDEDGYLPAQPEELPAIYPSELMRSAADVVKSLDPSGVGAATLEECLCLQLERVGKLTELRKNIIAEHLGNLSRGKWALAAQTLGVPEDTLKEEYALIRTLNPKPGAAIGGSGVTEYIKPELHVKKSGKGFEIEFDEKMPKMAVGRQYLDMLKNTDDNAVLEYIKGQVKNAEWMMSCLEKRRRTMHAVAGAIVEFQKEFFLRGNCALIPMQLSDIAGMVGMHESTVSRAIAGKYLECDHGVYEIKRLFQGTRGGNKGNCADVVKLAIRKILEKENGIRPFSDQAISILLQREGLAASRRTVTKYREQMGIVASVYRRR